MVAERYHLHVGVAAIAQIEKQIVSYQKFLAGLPSLVALSATLVAKSIEMEKVCPRKCEISCPRVSADRSRHLYFSTCLIFSKLQT